MGVKFGMEEGTFNVSPLRSEKPQNRPLSKLNTGRFALRAMLPVIIRLHPVTHLQLRFWLWMFAKCWGTIYTTLNAYTFNIKNAVHSNAHWCQLTRIWTRKSRKCSLNCGMSWLKLNSPSMNTLICALHTANNKHSIQTTALTVQNWSDANITYVPFYLYINGHSRWTGNWTTRGYANLQTGHLADWSTHGLDNSHSSQLVDWTTCGVTDAAKRTKTKHAKSPVASASCPVYKLSSLWVDQSASWRIRELSSNRWTCFFLHLFWKKEPMKTK